MYRYLNSGLFTSTGNTGGERSNNVATTMTGVGGEGSVGFGEDSGEGGGGGGDQERGIWRDGGGGLSENT